MSGSYGGPPYSAFYNHCKRENGPGFVENTNTRQQKTRYKKPNNDYVTYSNDDKSLYCISLKLDPVEMGFVAKCNGRNHEFKGIGAFNHYFGLVAPSDNIGYTLPDIWDGYFHITIAEFKSGSSPEQLENTFRGFKHSMEGRLPTISNISFTASNLKTILGKNRPRGRGNIDFLVLSIDLSFEIEAAMNELQPLIKEITNLAKAYEIKIVPLDELHITVRKYSNFKPEDMMKIKSQQFPIEFRCSHLELKQTREQAVSRFQKKRENGEEYKWWSGVTEIDKKCSGCHQPIESERWEGFCLKCGQHESMIPIWSTS